MKVFEDNSDPVDWRFWEYIYRHPKEIEKLTRNFSSIEAKKAKF